MSLLRTPTGYSCYYASSNSLFTHTQPHFTQAVFEGGDYCHKNPARSLRVKLECGGDERAWSASEPSTCAYIIHASTPAACRSESLQELQVVIRAVGWVGWWGRLRVCVGQEASGRLPKFYGVVSCCWVCAVRCAAPWLLWVHSFQQLCAAATTQPLLLSQSTLDALLAEEAALAKEIEEEERQRQEQLASMREKIGGGSVHDEL